MHPAGFSRGLHGLRGWPEHFRRQLRQFREHSGHPRNLRNLRLSGLVAGVPRCVSNSDCVAPPGLHTCHGSMWRDEVQ